MTCKGSLLFKVAVCLTIVCSTCGGADAQVRKQSLSIHWGAAIPAGESYIDKTSATYFSLEWNFPLFSTLSAGVSAGYMNNSDLGVADEHFDGGLSTGNRDKGVYVIPLMAQFDFFPMGDAETLLRPYLGVAAGARYAKFRITGDTIVTSGSSSWAESFSARLGTRIHPGGWSRFFLDARCTWNYGGNQWSLAKPGKVQYFGATAGVGWMF